MRKSLDDLIFEQQKSEPSQEEKEGLDALIFDEPSKKKAVSQPPLGGSPQPLQEAQDVSAPSASAALSTSEKTPFEQKPPYFVSEKIIAEGVPKEEKLAREYEISQNNLVGAQKGVDWATGRDEELKGSLDPEARKSAGKYTQDAAIKLGHAQFKADENISKLKEAIKGDLDYLGSNLENFTRKSQEEDVIADEVKIDEYAREQARKKGLPEDGYYKNFLYNNAKAEVAQKIIEPDVLKEREKLFKEKTGKSIEDAFGEDFAKGFTKAQEIEATAKTQINSVAQEINALAKTETEEIARDVNSQIEQLNAAYQQQASQVTDQAQADALHQEYTANFNKLQANFLDAQNQINGKYNQRLRRQADEIEKVANQKWSEEAEKYKKDYKASPELLEQLKTVSQEAYKKVVNSKEKVKEVRDLYTPAISNYYRSTVSSLGRSLGNLSETVGYDYGKVLGDYMENTYQVGSAELNSWKDLLDASKLAKSAGQLTGAMLPSMTAAAATTIATQGLGAPEAVSMLAGGLAAWTGESMDMAGNIERETFAATGDANKALERSKRMWDAQMAIMPLYSLEMLPFMKGFGLSKNIAKRMAGGAAAEYVTEVGQEYLQNRYEAVINADKEFSEIFKDASWKEFGHTALNVAPVAILGAGGQIRGEKSEQEKINDEAKAFALKSELFDVAPDQRAQFISDIVREKGQAFTSAYISNLYTNGTIPKSSADLLVKAMGVALEVDAKAKEYGFNEAQKKVFTAFKYKLINAQEQAANETDPILKQAADAKVKELEEQTVNFASGKEADYIVMTYPNGEQYVLSVGQGQNAAKNPKLQQAVADGAIKLEGSGKGVEVVNSVGENIKANKKAKVEAEKAGLVAETWQAIQERIYIQNANYAQKEKQDKEQAAIENGEAASQFYELGTPEAKTVELSTEITPKVGERQEPVKAEPIEEGRGTEVAPSGVLQTQEEKVVEIEPTTTPKAEEVAGETAVAQQPETETRETETPAQHTAGYSAIALDYLFTGGRDVIQSTDYLLQALVGGFSKASKEIDAIRNKYAAKIGNIKDDINTENYNAMMQEIKGVINKAYGSKKANDIFDKILKNATGFTSREGNQVSIELDKLNEQQDNTGNNAAPAQKLEESNIPTWHTEFERAKKENDLPAINTLYNKVKVALNGLAQSKGEATVKEFETLKKDIEKYAEEWKKQNKTNEKTKKEDSSQIESNLNNADKGKAKGAVRATEKPVPVTDKDAKKKSREIKKQQEEELKKRRKDLANAEPNDIKQLILQYFYGGGRILTEDFKNETGFGKRGGQQNKVRAFKEFKKRIWAHTGKSPSMDDLVMQFQDAWKANYGSAEDQQDIRNEIIGVLKDFDSKSQIERELERLFSVGGKIVTSRDERNQSQQEEDLMQRYTPESVEEAAQMEAWDAMNRSQQDFVMEDDYTAYLLGRVDEMTEEEAQEHLDNEEKFNQLIKQENENNERENKTNVKDSSVTAGQAKAAKEYEAELAELNQKLKDAEKAKRDKLDRISGKVDLFADEAKTDELFGAEQNLSAENIAKQLKPETDKIAKLEAEKAAFEANKETYLKKYDNQSEISEAAPEKVLTEKEKAAKELADRIRKKKWGGANVVFDFGLTKTIYNFAVDKVADAVESGTELGKAIQQAVEWIESQMNGKEWDKKGFSDSFSDEGNDGKVPPTEKDEKSERQKRKKILGTRAYEGEISEEEKAYLEEKGLFRGTYSQEERSQQAQEYIDKFGEDAALRAVDTLEIRGAVATSILAKLLVSADIKIAQLENTDTEKLDTLQKEKSDITAIMEREGYLSGEMVGQLAFEYENSDLKFNVEKQIEEYKAVNNGKIPPETEAKFRELDKEITQLKAQIAEAEEKAKRAEEQAAIQAIQEKNQRDKKNKISEQKASEKIEKAKKKILEKVRSAKIHRPDVFMAATPASLVWDSAVEAVEQTINAGLSVAAAVARGVEAIQESEWYKGLERERQVEAEQALQDFFNEEERTDGRLKIPTSLIRDLVARGHNTIESLTQAVREAISEQYPDATDREIRDAITGYGKVANLNQEEIATQIRKITRLGRLMSQMEDIQARKRPMRSGIQRDKLDAEERAKMKEVREAMKDLPVSEADLEQQMKTALDAAKTRLQNQIEDLQREIDKGERVPKNARTVKDDRELTALKEKRDKVKAEHDAIFNNEEVRQAKRLELAKKAAERRIKDLERRIREQDFTKKKPTPLLLDTELIRLRAEKMRLQEEYEKEIYKAKIANRNNWEIAKETFWDLVGLGRLFNATLDASFVGVQGGIMSSNLAVRNPKMLAEAFANMFRFALSEKKTEDFLRKLKAQDDYYKIKGAKLAITEPHAEITAREEHHFSDIGNMLWNLIGSPLKYKSEAAFNKWAELSPFKIFERAAIGFLDTVRVSKYMDAMQMLERQGKTFENDPQAFKNAADVVNTFTGRASLGFLEQQSKWLSRVFYSPRNWASVFKQTILFPRQITKWRDKETPFKPSVAQKMAVLDLSVNIATTLSMVTLAALYYGNDDDDETGVETDPRSSDFGKIKIGNTRVDPWGGKAQQVVLVSRIITEGLHRMYPSIVKGSYKTSDGDIVPLGTPYKAPTWKGLAGTMVSNKLNPATGLLLDYADTRREEDGELMTAFGQPYIFKDELKETYTPMITQTAKELLKDDPNALNGFLLATAYFGNSVNIYGKKTKKDILEKHEKAKENAKGDTKIKYEIVDKFLKENKAFIDGLEDEDFKDVMKNVKKEASAYANLSTDIRNITKEPDFKDYVEKVKGRPSYSTLTEEEKTIKKLSGADAVEYLFGKYKNEDLSKYPNNVSLDMTKYINNNVITAEERKEVISLIQKYQNNQK